ncbi:hypothetical protein EJ05DRAFT_374384 [Pseudovirgaria hyperparasitica]|uniref:DUF676 domain-containing protein n=1 Tax=Pseudovirgaria hyperparasitica TaxID=470096 RepID=A0A6A6W646_9PEZI|nr:uncharacterized protein EJ05DRAFT_374384 [Pseudovirgaria hyperparasitica]KAF2758015.1 hypothetical protein EJ05DRAFT_374384 [Pseudovirgaria hyperparasitica]
MAGTNMPPLPPRDSTPLDAPPPYTPYPHSNLESHDPRTSSTQSLLPEDAPAGQHRRRLLLVYIHGFQGDETSFQSFPAHVHNLVKISLADTHTVHTKIYPKYRTRRAIEFARDDFSAWLTPHEHPNTDVILLGHSMGGLLSAEVILIPTQSPHFASVFRHRILGSINFDVPFLGMHPGVISSGLASLFNPADKSTKEGAISETEALGTPGRADTLFRPPQDPGYNPAFGNDVNLPVRKGWEGTLHFLNKHRKHILKGGRQYVASHLEFGGAMADYSTLKKRYQSMRPLDEDDPAKRKTMMRTPGTPPRVRFVNYYTASTGRPKKPKPPKPEGPTMSNEEHREGSVAKIAAADSTYDLASQTQQVTITDTLRKDEEEEFLASLPAVPPAPVEPAPFDPSAYPNPSVLNFARKTHEREVNRYKQLLEDHEIALAERKELEEALRCDAREQRKVSEATIPTSSESQVATEHNDDDDDDGSPHARVIGQPITNTTSYDGFQDSYVDENDSSTNLQNTLASTPSMRSTDTDAQSRETPPSDDTPKKPKRDRKFCMLPSKDQYGKVDPTWVRVYMEGVDEVGAHCGLFFLSATYEQLVGDVAARIEGWVQEDMTRRLVEGQG